ncbi:DUF5067 domain-containing protein [Enterococcus larvae]|uniref:DUF5067 domain-containing protein n=1 Tax=Enterococcus larvae TaxID=2794352 RepID=UPI003F3BC10D
MKKRLSIFLWFGLISVLLTACQKGELNQESETFSADGSEYSIQIPEGWKVEDDYKEVFNEAAVFGVEDQNSRSVLFIRAQKSEPITEAELLEQTEKELSAYYKLETGEQESFEVEGYPAIHYLMPSVYEKKAVWLDIYYIVTENHIINLQCYRPRDNSAEKQQQLIRESVDSLIQVSSRESEKSEEDSQSEPEVTRQLENERLSVRITGSKVTDQQLILRYVITNKTEAPLSPLDEWEELFTVTEGTEKLSVVKQLETADDELRYLIEQSSQQIAAGKSMECAVVYDLHSEKQTITVQADADKIDGSTPMQLTIER